MAIIRGPFDIKWGNNTITDVETIDTEYTVDSEDFQTVQGKTLEIDGSHKATATITLLASDIPALAALLPQYFVANGEVLSTGETVNHASGAIDIAVAACDEEHVFNDLDIAACGNPADVVRLVNTRTRFDGIDTSSNKVRKVMIKFIGESVDDEATVQFFKEGTINVVS
jgi:hypothetical protein